MAISVRELTMLDEEPVAALLDRIRPDWSDALAPGASGPRAFVADPRTFLFGGYVDDEPAGWLWGSHLRRPDGRLMSYVHEVDVVEAQRRRGLASMLVEAALAGARRAGSHRLWLVSQVANAPADALYRSLGSTVSTDGDQRIHRWDL